MMRLYDGGETAFDTNGLGALPDAVSCKVTEELNGSFELELQYPMDGLHYQELQSRRLILAKPNPVDRAQPFRIYQISRPINGLVTVNAEHVSYDLNGLVLAPYTANSAAGAMAGIPAHAATDCPFTFFTDLQAQGDFALKVPTAARAALGGQEGSIWACYGGEFRFDRFQVSLLGARGRDNGVLLRYGKNLTDLTQEENISGVYTGVYPYWAGQEDYVELPEQVVLAQGDFGFTRILPLDCSGDFQEAPTAEQLRERAQTYMADNRIGVPAVSITLSFVPLEQTLEYQDLALLERVGLGDTVHVQFEKLGVDATAQVVKTVYDVLKDRYESVEVGGVVNNLADTILQQQQEIQKRPSGTALQSAIDSATGQITGNKGGYVVLHSAADTTGFPDEILIMDTPDIATAQRVWRWNKSGLGYSSNGYNGPYTTAITQDGAIVADFITTGTLSANLIKTGSIISQDGSMNISIDNGELISTSGDNSLTISNAAIRLVVGGDLAYQVLVQLNPSTAKYWSVVKMGLLNVDMLVPGSMQANAGDIYLSDGANTGALTLKTMTVDGQTINYVGWKKQYG